MPTNVHTIGSRVSKFSPSSSGGAGGGRLIFTNQANSTLDNQYVIGSGVSSTMLGAGIRGALKRRATTRSEKLPEDISSTNDEWDLIIIGAGICGAQIATRYMSDFPNGKVLILESGNQVGGVLRSLPQSTQPEGGEYNLTYRASDMGAMRYYPGSMPMIANLVTSLGLTSVDVPVTTPKTYLYAFGQRKYLAELGNTWTLYGSDLSYNPIAEVEKNSEAILAELFNVDTYDPRLLALYNNRVKLHSSLELSQKAYPTITIPFKSRFSTGFDFDRITGYRNLIFGPTASAVSVLETVSVGRTSQVSVKEGTQNIVVKMFERLNSSIIFLNDAEKTIIPQKGVNIILGARVNRLERTGKISIVQSTGNSGFDNTSFIVPHTKEIIVQSDRVAITTHPSSLSKMLMGQGVGSYIERLNTSFEYFNGCKLFLRYENTPSWWINTEYRNSGRHLTETYMGQLWFYDDNTLLMYNTGIDSQYWADLFQQNESLQRLDDTFRVFGNEENTSKWWQAFKIFADDIVPGFSDKNPPSHYAVSIYSDQVPLWREKENGESIIQRRQILRHPFTNTYSKISWAHNALSIYQGWMEGSLEEGNILYDEWKL